MKIIELCRLTENGEDIDIKDTNAPDPRDWWCVIETEEEELFYEKYVAGNKGLAGETNAEHIWNEMVKHAGQDMGLHWGDDDVYGYIMPSEKYPEVGQEYIDSSGDKWVRTE